MFCSANDTFCTANFTFCTGLELIDVLLANQNEEIVACILLSNKTLSTSLLFSDFLSLFTDPIAYYKMSHIFKNLWL